MPASFWQRHRAVAVLVGRHDSWASAWRIGERRGASGSISCCRSSSRHAGSTVGAGRGAAPLVIAGRVALNLAFGAGLRFIMAGAHRRQRRGSFLDDGR